MAVAEMPFATAFHPMPSLVVPRLTASGSMPSTAARLSRIACRYGARRGCSHTMMTSTFRRPTVHGQAVDHLPQQLHAGGAAVGRVGVGKDLTDVAGAGRAQQRVHERVDGDVGVGVAGEALAGARSRRRRAPAGGRRRSGARRSRCRP